MSNTSTEPAPQKYSDFVSQIKSSGIAKQNRFHISLPRPNKLEGTGITAKLFSGASQANRMLHLMCKSVTVPGMNIATQPMRIVGEAIEMPYDRTYGGATISFYVDNKFYVRQFFNDWLDTIQSPKTRVLSYYDDIVSDIVIYVETPDGKTRYMQKLHEAFPKSIGDLTLDHSNNDLMMINVTFEYRFYESMLLGEHLLPGDAGTAFSVASMNKLFSGDGSFYGSTDYEKIVTLYKNDVQGFQQAVNSASGTLTAIGDFDVLGQGFPGGDVRSFRI